MALQTHLEAIDKKQAAIEQTLQRMEAKLDTLYTAVSLSDAESRPEGPRFTPADFEPIDGVGPTIAQKIMEVIEGK